MDLTKNYPRSVHDRLAGIVQLARTADKARAYNDGKLGDYHYNCPMDQALFEFLGTEHVEFAREAVADDAQLARWVQERFLSKKTAAQIREWNAGWAAHAPERGSDSERFFIEQRDRIAPNRSDVRSWPDLLDLEEGRNVPKRKAA